MCQLLDQLKDELVKITNGIGINPNAKGINKKKQSTLQAESTKMTTINEGVVEEPGMSLNLDVEKLSKLKENNQINLKIKISKKKIFLK